MVKVVRRQQNLTVAPNGFLKHCSYNILMFSIYKMIKNVQFPV